MKKFWTYAVAPTRSDKITFKNQLLAFPDDIEARYEQDTGAERAAHLSRTIIIGLIFYNIYNLSDYILMPDIFWLGVALRVFIVTPGSLGLVWAVTRVSPRVREALVTFGMVNAIALPVFLFCLTESPRGSYTFGELPLTLVFGTMMLILRFSHALVFLLISLAMILAAVATKKSLDTEVAIAFALQAVTGVFFVLYGNYKIESSRRGAYLIAMEAILQSHRSESARKQFAALSATDALTGLANRRVLDETMAEWSMTPVDVRTSIAVLMIDVDHFKVFNDTYGHPVGDECLRRIARAIITSARTSNDLAVRYGGEEFTLLLRNCDEIGLKSAAERLRTAVEDLGIPHCDRKDGIAIVTVSLGGTVVPSGQSCTVDTIFAAADRALYDAKLSGRNCYRYRRLTLWDTQFAAVSA